MRPESIRRLALADVNELRLRALIDHGEDLFVERKRKPPEGPKFGAEVSSLANMLGGFILVGVGDDKTIVGYAPKSGMDLQSHIGNLLRHSVSPVPPFLAEMRDLEEGTVGVIRVFESTAAPVIVRQTGAVYTRDAGGKRPVDDHRELVDLARRGERARGEAMRRLVHAPLAYSALLPPDTPTEWIARGRDEERLVVTVRAAPLTVTPQFGEWPISRRGAEACMDAARSMIPPSRQGEAVPDVEPHGRGVVSRWSDGGSPRPRSIVVVADAAGVVGATLALPLQRGGGVSRTSVRTQFVDPLARMVADMLVKGEAYGEAVADVWLSLPLQSGFEDALRNTSRDLHVVRDLAIPADGEEIAEFVSAWEREIARECGEQAWEGEARLP